MLHVFICSRNPSSYIKYIFLSCLCTEIPLVEDKSSLWFVKAEEEEFYYIDSGFLKELIVMKNGYA